MMPTDLAGHIDGFLDPLAADKIAELASSVLERSSGDLLHHELLVPHHAVRELASEDFQPLEVGGRALDHLVEQLVGKKPGGLRLQP